MAGGRGGSGRRACVFACPLPSLKRPKDDPKHSEFCPKPPESWVRRDVNPYFPTGWRICCTLSKPKEGLKDGPSHEGRRPHGGRTSGRPIPLREHSTQQN